MCVCTIACVWVCTNGLDSRGQSWSHYLDLSTLFFEIQFLIGLKIPDQARLDGQ